MNKEKFSYVIEPNGNGNVFSLISHTGFSLNIEKPLLHLEGIYRKLYKHLLEKSYIDSGVVNKNMAVFRCEQ